MMSSYHWYLCLTIVEPVTFELNLAGKAAASERPQGIGKQKTTKVVDMTHMIRTLPVFSIYLT